MLNTNLTLPPASNEQLAHSDKLCALLHHEIKAAGGQIPFSRYMELALYAPGLGYYSAGSHKFGVQGDFTTAPESAPLFSKCLANQCLQVLENIDDGVILEFGAGSGIMAATILLELEDLDCLPAHYYILEVSADLQQRQREKIKSLCPHLFARVTWLQGFPETPIKGIVLANEVLDAMPVNLFKLNHGNVSELYVRSGQPGELPRQPVSYTHLTLPTILLV